MAPMSKDELEIRRNVYRTKHPERRLIYNTRIPFIDESESWAFELIYVYQLYAISYFTEVISPLMLALVISNAVFIVLSFYQVVVSNSHMSPIRYAKFLVYLSGVTLEFYYVCCNSSEMADDCNRLIVNTIIQSNWENCALETQRDLHMFLRRVQRSNHLTFNGVLVLDMPLFANVIKFAYNFV
ncbi:hypothetical protein WDU94_010690 [Cyamophila willieti]